MEYFDVVGMDWLHSCYVLVDYKTRVVKFEFPDVPVTEWSSSSIPKGHFISYFKARKLVFKEYVYHVV